ncbi:MAG: DNA repair protein RecO [Actinomycetes bacterium]
MSLYRDEAVVLRTWKLGEADRIVVVFGRASGKVRAVAKGARKTGSRFGARMEPGAHVQIQLYKGRGELDTVTQVETVEAFRNTRGDLSRLSTAAALLEAVDHIAQDREPQPKMFSMLVGALRVVEERDAPLVTAGFYLKLLALEGVAPEFDICVGCGEPADTGEPVLIALEAGGVHCRSCGGGRPLSPEALAVSRAIVGGGLASALELPASPLAAEVQSLATTAMEAHLERRIRSLHVLDEA